MDNAKRPILLPNMFIRFFLSTLRSTEKYAHLCISLHAAMQLPISIRKVIITACQVGGFDYSDYRDIPFPPMTNYLTSTTENSVYLTPSDFYVSISAVVSSPASASILWMVLRTTTEPSDYDESDSVALASYEKELSASQTLFF
jgi:hypothetical protein